MNFDFVGYLTGSTLPAFLFATESLEFGQFRCFLFFAFQVLLPVLHQVGLFGSRNPKSQPTRRNRRRPPKEPSHFHSECRGRPYQVHPRCLGIHDDELIGFHTDFLLLFGLRPRKWTILHPGSSHLSRGCLSNDQSHHFPSSEKHHWKRRNPN